MPGYLSYVTGLTGTDLTPTAAPATATHATTTHPTTAHATTVAPAMAAVAPHVRRRGRAVAGSALFVAGFTAVFTVLAYAAGQLGRTLLVHARAGPGTGIRGGVPVPGRLRRICGALAPPPPLTSPVVATYPGVAHAR